MWSPAGLDRTSRWFDGWNPAGLTVGQAVETLAALNDRRPDGAAPLTLHLRVFVQQPNRAAPEGDPVQRIADTVAEAARAGVDEVIVEHNFCDELTENPAVWAQIPERFAPVLDAARGSSR